MPQQVRGLFARSQGAPVEVTTITIPDPGPGEVMVRVQACGVCHTDLTYREGGINDEFPFLLGHEAAGIVEEVGAGVDSVAVGDFVILNWRAVCGQCRACKRGRPQYCFDTHNASQKMTLEDGTELTPALGIGAFAEKTLVHAGSVHQGRSRRRPRGGRAAGCGVMAGLGAAVNTGNVSRGDSSRSSAAEASATPPSWVPAWRARARSSRSTAIPASWSGPASWAPPTPSTRPKLDTVEAVQELTGGFGADVVIDAVGRPETWKQAFYARDLAGTVVLVGVPTPDLRLEMPLIDFFSRGGSLKSSWYGDCLPERDFPTLVDLYQQGRLPLERFVSERIKLDEVEDAFHTMHAGEVLRSVVVL